MAILETHFNKNTANQMLNGYGKPFASYIIFSTAKA